MPHSRYFATRQYSAYTLPGAYMRRFFCIYPWLFFLSSGRPRLPGLRADVGPAAGLSVSVAGRLTPPFWPSPPDPSNRRQTDAVLRLRRPSSSAPLPSSGPADRRPPNRAAGRGRPVCPPRVILSVAKDLSPHPGLDPGSPNSFPEN